MLPIVNPERREPNVSLNISDQEFTESCDNRERMYRDELRRDPIDPNRPEHHPHITFMDKLGRGRWPLEYITARQRGHSHASAMQVERVHIRAAAGLPPTEPMPPDPLPPQPGPPQPGQDVPGVKDDAERFVAFYRGRAEGLGFKPDDTTSREQRIRFLAETLVAFGKPGIVMKRADAGRPISDEVIVFTAPTFPGDHRRFWDFIKSGGTSAFQLRIDGPGEILPGPTGQEQQLLVDPRTLQVMPG
jgi:hypothetical protein